MKKLLILFSLLASGVSYAAEQIAAIDLSSLNPGSAEIVPFLKQNNAPEKREFLAMASITMGNGQEKLNFSPFISSECPSVKVSRYQDNGVVTGGGVMKCFLGIRLMSRMPSMDILKNQVMRDSGVVLGKNEMTQGNNYLQKAKEVMGDISEWVEFDQLTTVSLENNEDQKPAIYRAMAIMEALNLVKQFLPQVKLARTYLKSDEHMLISAYGAYDFKKSDHQYMTSCGLTVYEKQLD